MPDGQSGTWADCEWRTTIKPVRWRPGPAGPGGPAAPNKITYQLFIINYFQNSVPGGPAIPLTPGVPGVP